jgi:hypothetical protein
VLSSPVFLKDTCTDRGLSKTAQGLRLIRLKINRLGEVAHKSDQVNGRNCALQFSTSLTEVLRDLLSCMANAMLELQERAWYTSPSHGTFQLK